MDALFDLLRAEPVAFVFTVVAFTLLIGSFLNVVIHRLPLMMHREWAQQCAELANEDGPDLSNLPEKYNLVVPRSGCPQCGHQITAMQNIPVVSYLVLGGKCAGCKAPISKRYPIIEALTALLCGFTAWHFGFGAEALAAIMLTIALVALSAIDIDTQLLPDSITLPLIWLGLIMSLFHPHDGATALFISPSAAIVGAVAGYMSLWLVTNGYKLLTGKIGMGEGDFKLLAVFGAWLGWQKLPLIILLSAGVGAVVGIALIVVTKRGKNVPIPFGPYLAAAGWIAMLFGDQIISTYLGVAGLN